jgi:hypothetical protein
MPKRRKPGRAGRVTDQEGASHGYSGSAKVTMSPPTLFGLGYPHPIVTEEAAKRAMLNGFILLEHLVGYLAEDETLQDVVPVLWRFFECDKIQAAPKSPDDSDPVNTWRRLGDVWVGFLDPKTASILPPFQTLDAYDYDSAKGKFIKVDDRSYPEFVRFVKVKDVERLFHDLSALLNIELRLPSGLASVSSREVPNARTAANAPNKGSAGQSPTISFYREGENGDHWTIGFLGKERSLDHLNGFIYLRTLLQNPGKEIACANLYHGSSEPLDYAEGRADQGISWEDRKSGGYDALGPDKQELISQQDIPTITAAIEFLKEQKETLESSQHSSSEATTNCPGSA